ncbi:K(+)-transporting ATPase subunit F [Paucibacter sp. R3-3]|uniref:K(+)-transporting ATPase subunit F n=1 Tax=Roseateles agri TaxID=3098619 RepID=A0ABU5DT04_9BURK|nr:K(+)-transporting ATPase subunit F [Paucibacter sp. R3-3]MDY0748920.1 K(+)-transporting ATPase subunit F [Paucibacter sp. R3-3]
MIALYWICGLVAAGLFAYLVYAMFRAEEF